LIKFIKDNKDWKEKLQQKPYCIKIVEDGNYIKFNYSQIDSDFSNPIVKECRGITIDKNDFKVVCFPFTKFFNIDEPNADTIDWSSVCVQEKIDGSLIAVWTDPYTHNINISTNGMIDAEKASLQSDLIKFKNFKELFLKAINLDNLSLNNDYTYIFELVSPYNRVVINYDKIDAFHIGTRDNKSGKELNVDIGVKKPKVYDLNNELDIKASANQLGLSLEGYVLVDKFFNRVKVKSPTWIRAHYLSFSGNIDDKRVVSLIKANEIDEFISYFPDFKDKIKNIQDRLDKYIIYLENMYIFIKNTNFIYKNRKEFAEWVSREKNDSQIAFLIYDRKIKDIEDIKKVVLSWNENKILERINKYV